jgi:hypothetical protein
MIEKRTRKITLMMSHLRFGLSGCPLNPMTASWVAPVITTPKVIARKKILSNKS